MLPDGTADKCQIKKKPSVCRSHMSHLPYVQSLTVPLSASLPAVKPTVIDVGIYVNSIGPVSSIDMVSSGLHTHLHPSPHIHVIVCDRGCSLEGWKDRWTCVTRSCRSPQSKQVSLKADLCWGRSLLSGQAAGLCGGDATSARS